MSKERAKLFKEAEAVGLKVGEDFKSNISSTNLQKKIDTKKEELASALQGGNDNGTTEEATVKQIDPVEEIETTAEVDTKKEEIEAEEKTHDDEIKIKRISPCGNYPTTIIGIKEAARRTPNVTEEQIKEALENGELVSGWTFKEVE